MTAIVHKSSLQPASEGVPWGDLSAIRPLSGPGGDSLCAGGRRRLHGVVGAAQAMDRFHQDGHVFGRSEAGHAVP